MKLPKQIRIRLRRWLLSTLQPCRQMVPLMSESMERRLTIVEFVKLRLHLLVCAWCARYLKQIKFMRWLLRAPRPEVTGELAPSLANEARDRIAKALAQNQRSELTAKR